MKNSRDKEEIIRCQHENGTVTLVPSHIFNKVIMEMEIPNSTKYVTFKEGAKMYRMSEKFFREWANNVGAVKRVTEKKAIVSVKKLDEFLEYI